MGKKYQNLTLKNPSKTNLLSSIKGPNIRAFFFVSSDKILRIELKIASYFSYEYIGKPNNALRQAIDNWITSYLNKETSSLFNYLNYPKNFSKFYQQAHLALSQTSFKTTLTYQQLAESAGSPNACRAVGSVCKNNSFPLVIPCHRVILSNGKLGQYNGGVEIKKRLLHFEEAFFKD